jgi:hypothetical protein
MGALLNLSTSGTLPRVVQEFVDSIDPVAPFQITVCDEELSEEFYRYKRAKFYAEGKFYQVIVERPAISSVHIGLNSLVVTKTISKSAELGILEREVNWLRALASPTSD